MPYPHECYRCGKDLGGSYMSYFGNYCHYECHPETIEAKQTAERHYQRGRADAADEIARLTAERDTARAETAMAFEAAGQWLTDAAAAKGGTKTPAGRSAQFYARKLRTLTPAHATAALEARDKATREAALRETQPTPQEAEPVAWRWRFGDSPWAYGDTLPDFDRRYGSEESQPDIVEALALSQPAPAPAVPVDADLDALISVHRSKADGTVRGAFHQRTADVIVALRAHPTPQVKALVDAARGMRRIVEEIDGAMNHGTWRDDHGTRLKDTPEWVSLYNALSALSGEAQR